MMPKKWLFCSRTSLVIFRKISTMEVKLLPPALVAAVIACGGLAHAANTPLDFSYRVTGPTDIRPLMVFNDGVDTFIQPQDVADKSIKVNGAQPVRQGPYFVVKGVAPEITLSQGKTATAFISYFSQKQRAVGVADKMGWRAEDKPAVASKPTGGASQQEGPKEVVSAAQAALAAPKTESKPVDAKQGDEKPKHAGTSPLPKQDVCQPHKEYKDSALVATFKSNTATLSENAKAQIKEFVRNPSDVTEVEIIAEGGSTAATSALKRGEAIKSVLVEAGIVRGRIQVVSREATGIGTEIYLHRTVEIPCGATIVKAPSRKTPLTVIWDGDARSLVERLATELKMPLVVEGVAHPVPVRMAMIDVPFGEGMAQIGRTLDADADLILRPKEMVLKFKEKK